MDKKKVDITPEDLEDAQATNISFLEQWAREISPDIAGVPIIVPFNYELIQVINNFWLGDTIGEQE